MEKNILKEINRLKEIMGLDIIQEQIDVEDEIIDEPTKEFPYVKWNSNGLTIYTEKEDEDKNIGGPVGGYRYIGPFGDNGYVTLGKKGITEFDGERIRIDEPVTPVIGGNMDIPFIEIDNRKSNPQGQANLYNRNEGSRFVGNQSKAWNYQNREMWDRIGEDLRTYGIQQTKGQFRFLVYGVKTKQRLAMAVTSIRLRGIEELKAMGKTEGETSKKKGYLSMNNYIPKNRKYAWNLEGDVRLLPTAGIEEWRPKTPPQVVTQEFKFSVTDPFEFDKADITQSAAASIKDELNKIYILKQKGVLKQYVQKKLNGKQIIVNAFSSIDANPEEIGGGKFPKCSTRKNGSPTGLRKDYNLCLSQARAEAVVKHLQENYSDLFGKVKLKAVGRGENNKSGNAVYANYNTPEQKQHEKEGRVATKEDRRFEVQLPNAVIKNGKLQ